MLVYRGVGRYDIMLHLKFLWKILVAIEKRRNEDAHEIKRPWPLLRLQTIKAIIDSRSFKSLKSDEPRRVQVLDLYCLTRFESESSSKGIVY